MEKIIYASATNIGNSRSSKGNQDATSSVIYEQTTVFSTADGHGSLGGLAANVTVKNFPKFFMEFLGEDYSINDSFKLAFKKTDELVCQSIFKHLVSKGKTIHQKKVHEGISEDMPSWHLSNGMYSASKDLISGGTTFSVVVIKLNDDGSKTVHVASVGDSDVIANIGLSKYEKMTANHSPSSQEEFERIMGFTDAYPQRCKPRVVFDKFDRRGSSFDTCADVYIRDDVGEITGNQPESPYTKNMKGELATYFVSPEISTCHEEYIFAPLWSALAVTRALGDVNMKPFGLSCEPHIETFEVASDQNVILISATDGIWDCYKRNEMVMEYFSSPKAIEQFSTEETATIFVKNWLDRTHFDVAKGLFGSGMDNMTISVIKIGASVDT